MPDINRDSTRSEPSPSETRGVDAIGEEAGLSVGDREYIDELIEDNLVKRFDNLLGSLRVARDCIDRKIRELERARPTPPGGAVAARDQEGRGESQASMTMESTQKSSGEVRTGTYFPREQAIYESLKPDLLTTHEGEFVVIGGEEVAGVWPSYEEALRAGYSRFGLSSFLVQQILAVDPVAIVTRDILPCRT
jgi:hypothetical protein